MLILNKLHIVGFCSYEGDNTLELNPKSAVVIKAPNGCGKSTIFSALVWGLYGKNLKGSFEVNTRKKWRTKEYSGTMVEVFFTKDSSVYKVVRCYNYTKTLDDGAKGKDRLLIIKDAEIVDIKGKVKLQEYLVSVLGLSYNLFMNSIMFGQGMERLIQDSNSDKKKLFEEVFNLNYLNVAKSIAQTKKNELAYKVRELESRLSTLKGSYSTNKEAYKDFLSREHHFKESLRKDNKELTHKRKELTTQLSKLKSHYSEENHQIIKVKIKRKEKRLVSLKEELATAKSISNQPLEEVIENIIKLLEKNKVKRALSDMRSIQKAFADIQDLMEEKDLIMDELGGLRKVNNDLTHTWDRCDILSDKIVEVDKEIEALKSKKLKIVSPKYHKKCKDIRHKILGVKKAYLKEKQCLDDYIWLLDDPLSNHGIKAFLFDSSLELLNNTLEKYSEILGFRIAFEVDLDSAKRDFVTTIEMDGEIFDYDELSGGQKQLCNVAMAFAMNESLTASKNINIAFLDEVFESLSSDNIDIVISLIRSIFEDKVLFLITHRESLPLSNFKTLKVERAHGRSTFKLL